MRLYQLILAVMLLALMLSVSRSEQGKITLIVFLTALATMLVGATALTHLFRTVGAFGHAERLKEQLEAIAATMFIVFVASSLMNLIIGTGIFLVQQFVPK
ncbi:MAG: hypothetical protein KatS3mg108_0631 [Isosphaeraceae bacterium]|jgi:Kef-type K+ transport system membrane component KefB|nr:MAG: hypothetical protein KatS3mg108_0631 [Isosphaeraceae bacterium]